MSRTPRRTAAGLALAAAGVLYRRLSGRRQQPPAPPDEPAARSDELTRARAELARELARRAGRPEG